MIVKIDAGLEPLITKFLNYLRIEAAAIVEAAAVGNLETLKLKGHTLKGTCGGYGFDELGDLALELETNATQGNHVSSRESAQRFKDYVESMEIEFV